jgi:hypothetical protein
MHKNKRELLVMFNNSLLNEESIEQAVEDLHAILLAAERVDNFVVAHELIDLNKYVVTNNAVQIKKYIRLRKKQSFVFLYSKN